MPDQDTRRAPTPDYKAMSGPDMVHALGMDATKWASAFCQYNPEANVDEHVVMGWFANAIMHTLDLERGTIINGEHAEYLMSRDPPSS